MDRLLELLLRRFVRRGTLRFTTARGSVFTVGDGTGPPRRDPLHDHGRPARRAARSRAQARRSLHGRHVAWSSTARSPTCSRIVLGQTNDGTAAGLGAAAMVAALSLSPAAAVQSAARARRNVAHHYDLDDRLYSLFLDADRQYSCAYFETPDQSLDDAQLAKKRHLAAKLVVAARPAHARHRLRLGRACALSRRVLPARASPASRCRRSSGSAPASAPPRRT